MMIKIVSIAEGNTSYVEDNIKESWQQNPKDNISKRLHLIKRNRRRILYGIFRIGMKPELSCKIGQFS